MAEQHQTHTQYSWDDAVNVVISVQVAHITWHYIQVKTGSIVCKILHNTLNYIRMQNHRHKCTDDKQWLQLTSATAVPLHINDHVTIYTWKALSSTVQYSITGSTQPITSPMQKPSLPNKLLIANQSTGWAKKPDCCLKVCSSHICWHRIAFCISNCSVLLSRVRLAYRMSLYLNILSAISV